VVAPQPRRHGPHHRAAHEGTADREPPSTGNINLDRNEPPAGRDLARSWRRGTKGLCLVTAGLVA
jgi:hypothetical protein